MKRGEARHTRKPPHCPNGLRGIFFYATELTNYGNRLQIAAQNPLNPTHLITYSPIYYLQLLILIRHPALLLLQIAAGNSSLQAEDSVRNANFIFRTYGK